MKRPRDFDAELRALTEKAKELKAKRMMQMGELVVATTGDRITLEILGGLLVTARDATSSEREVWRAKGEAYFRSLERTPKPAPATPRKIGES